MTTIRPKRRPPLSLLVAGLVMVVLALPLLAMASVVALSRAPDVLVASLIANATKIALALSAVLLAGALTGYVFWRGLAGPIRRLAGEADAVARGAPGFSAEGPFGTQEVAGLAASFAAVVARLQARSRYLETLSMHLAHEVKSPLTAIWGAAELLRDEGAAMDPGERARFLDNILLDADRLSALVARLRDLARADMATAGAKGRTPLVEAAAVLASTCPDLEVRLFAPPGAVLPMSADGLGIVLRHLADNARRHGARCLDLTVADSGALDVANDGQPIAAADAERIFQPFFTTRRAEGGTGLGLAIVASLIANAGGRITLADTDPVRFRLEFPA